VKQVKIEKILNRLRLFVSEDSKQSLAKSVILTEYHSQESGLHKTMGCKKKTMRLFEFGYLTFEKRFPGEEHGSNQEGNAPEIEVDE
jgi:hypothetical protein